jgi:hypothetical protein
MDSRRGLTDVELEILADKLAVKITQSTICCITTVEQKELQDFLKTKKQTIKYTLYLMGAMLIWVLKDVYIYVKNSITWIK